jgi:Right handed beta helix region
MLKHKTTTTLAITALAAALVALAVGPSARAATTPITACGQTVTTNAFLAQDLDCAWTGIVVGATGITIDLNGHVLKGDHSLGYDGIDDDGYDVTIKNGVIRNFDDGVFIPSGAGGVANVSISNVVSTGNVRVGLAVYGDQVSIKNSSASGNGTVGIEAWGKVSVTSTTAAANGTYGIWLRTGNSSVRSSSALGNVSTGIVLEGDSNSVTSSTTSGNGGWGLSIKGNHASVKSTKASSNAGHGIEVSGDAATLKSNQAQGNGFLGGISDGVGQGILVSGYTIAPGGTNLARGNDDPAECSPASLCPAGSSAKAAATPITTCAQLVTTNAVLTQNLNCAGQGIVVGASGITINLNAHVLKGNNGFSHGIVDTAGYDDVTITNGAVRNFDAGIAAANGADNITISNVTVSGNTSSGIGITGSSASIKASTVLRNGGDGIGIVGDSASITSSTAAGNGANGIYVLGNIASVKSSGAFGNTSNGIYLKGASASIVSSNGSGNGFAGVYVDGDSASIQSTTASGNVTYGFFVSGDAGTLTRNRAEANGFPGGASDGVGLGIYYSGNFTTASADANIARGNDDPVGCKSSALC